MLSERIRPAPRSSTGVEAVRQSRVERPPQVSSVRAALKLALWLRRLHGQLRRGYYGLTFDYDLEFRRRWTENSPHEELNTLISRRRSEYQSLLQSFLAFGDDLRAIPDEQWHTPWLPPLDAIALYGLIATRRPKRYFEVGSGVTTKFVRQAIEDQRLSTKIISVDPNPRIEIDRICDEVHRHRFEDLDLDWTATLQAGDMFLLDGSHRSLNNSDVTVFFLEVMPRLPPGVLIGIHDVFLPYDYPAGFIGRFYSEQYMLATMLLNDRGSTYQVELPSAYVGVNGIAAEALAPLWRWSEAPHGGMFWMLKNE